MPAAQILIADDDPFLRDLLTHKLSLAGYAVTAVEDGQAALEQIRATQFDLIVLDGMMPVMDGFEALRRLRADPRTASVTVIMLTALKREENIVGALDLGAADYLVKPFIPDELLARIKRLLASATEMEAHSGRRDSNAARS